MHFYLKKIIYDHLMHIVFLLHLPFCYQFFFIKGYASKIFAIFNKYLRQSLKLAFIFIHVAQLHLYVKVKL